MPSPRRPGAGSASTSARCSRPTRVPISTSSSVRAAMRSPGSHTDGAAPAYCRWHAFSASTVIRLAIVNDYELVVAGVAAMLANDRHRIRVTAIAPAAGSIDGVDVVLYDTYGPVDSSMAFLEVLVRRSRVPVIVYTWKLQPAVAREALRRGASGYLSKALTGSQ